MQRMAGVMNGALTKVSMSKFYFMKRNTRSSGMTWRRSTSILFIFGLLFIACQKDDIYTGDVESSRSSFTLDLDFDGGLDLGVLGEEVKPLELTASNNDLRVAGINLTRDPNSRKFMLNLDISKDRELPVVIACRRTDSGGKQVFVGRTNLTLLADGRGQATRKFRIQKSGVEFYPLKDDGLRGDKNEFERLPNSTNATYEIKLFVGAQLTEQPNSSGKKRYLINYGLANSKNESDMFMMKEDGSVSLKGIQEKVPFISDWAKVLFGHNARGEAGLSNNYATIIKDGLTEIQLKAQGSILILDLQNIMKESTIKLQKLRVYSESLTANIVYDYKSASKDFSPEPAARHKNNPKDEELYFVSSMTPNIDLNPKTGKRTFVFWAQGLSEEYLAGEDWVQTSVVAQVQENQGAQGEYRKYWFNMPLLKTYSRLSRLHNGRATKTTIKFEDGTPVHPMNLMAHRFPVDGDDDWWRTNWQVQWRSDDYWKSMPQSDWERTRLYISSDVAKYWRRRPITTLEFGKVSHVNPMTFVEGSEKSYYEWRPASIHEISALFVTGANQTEIDKTWNGSPTIIREEAAMEVWPRDTQFYSIYQLKADQKIAYAIRFLRQTTDGRFYMTPYTAAYRYDYKGSWRNDEIYSTLEIKMRPLGGTTHQYNIADGQNGYYSPTFSLDQLKKLFNVVTGAASSNVIPHQRWWLDNPLREDDIVREYPALGFVGAGWWTYNPGAKLTIMTHNATPSESVPQDGIHNLLVTARDDNFKTDWYSSHDFAPVVLLARRKVLSSN